MAVESPRLMIWPGETAAADELAAILGDAGHPVIRLSADGTVADDVSSCGLAVLDGGSDAAAAQRLCRDLRSRGSDGFLPVIYLSAGEDGHCAGFAAGADVCLARPFEPEQLLGQVRALLRIRDVHLRLLAQTAEAHHVNHRLRQAYQRIDHEMELARRIQQSFLPQTLPQVPHLGVAVHYRPCGRIGGDFYDVFRLDENHLGFYVADAMGHGLPASLLTIYLKKGVRPKEITGKDYRLIPPDEVLQRLNHEMIEQRMLKNSFITMVYGLLNFQDGTLRFSRAGHPLPICLPAGGAPEPWHSAGPILGVFESAFPVKTHALHPGDRVLFFTDGIDAVQFEQKPPGVPSLMACAARRQGLALPEFVETVAAELSRNQDLTDDFTLLALEWRK